MNNKVSIKQLATGVPGLDEILGGGLPEFSFNLIAGVPGSGKTTLAHQIMFALATPEKPALFFTVLGETPLKMLRYQQQYAFFDLAKMNKTIRFVNLSEEVTGGDFEVVLDRIAKEVKAFAPALVFVDSFRSIVSIPHPTKHLLSTEEFVHKLGIHMSSWQATTFLIGEYANAYDPNPVCTVADGLLLLTQNVHRNSMVRQMQVLKMRGQPTSPGMHTFRITQAGLEVFPATVAQENQPAYSQSSQIIKSKNRLSMGIAQLDEMLGGGLPEGYSLLVAGPSGSGKTVLATAFLKEGVRQGEPGVIVAFEQTPSQSWNPAIDDMVRAGKIGLINTRSLALSIDEIVLHLNKIIHQMKATRVVIDSLSGFELAVAPTFREDFRESLFRMVAVLAGLGVTVLMTSELEDRYNDLRFSPYGSAFLTDAIIVQRYIEVKSSLHRVMAVVKVRASQHSKEIRQYEITEQGLVIGDVILEYEGLLGGRPTFAKSNSSFNDHH